MTLVMCFDTPRQSVGVPPGWARCSMSLLNEAAQLHVNLDEIGAVYSTRRGTLYDAAYEESSLDQTVGELRSQLRLNAVQTRTSAMEIVRFIFWAMVSVLAILIPPLVVLSVIGWVVLIVL